MKRLTLVLLIVCLVFVIGSNYVNYQSSAAADETTAGVVDEMPEEIKVEIAKLFDYILLASVDILQHVQIDVIKVCEMLEGYEEGTEHYRLYQEHCADF